MRIEYISKDNYSIFINNNYVDLNDYNDKNSIVKMVKGIIKKIQNILNLRGFYKIGVYVCKRLGFFISINKIDDSCYCSDIETRWLNPFG